MPDIKLAVMLHQYFIISGLKYTFEHSRKWIT